MYALRIYNGGEVSFCKHSKLGSTDARELILTMLHLPKKTITSLCYNCIIYKSHSKGRFGSKKNCIWNLASVQALTLGVQRPELFDYFHLPQTWKLKPMPKWRFYYLVSKTISPVETRNQNLEKTREKKGSYSNTCQFACPHSHLNSSTYIHICVHAKQSDGKIIHCLLRLFTKYKRWSRCMKYYTFRVKRERIKGQIMVYEGKNTK